MANRFMLNETSYHGHGAILNIVPEIKARGFKNVLVCTDESLVKFGVSQKVTKLLDEGKVNYQMFTDIKPNPTIENVLAGVKAAKEFKADSIVAIVDPDMMSTMPKGLTAATGMDALTHAIEGYITRGAWEMSDMFHIKAIELIGKNLRKAVANDPDGREGMALGQYIAGMGFSNVGLGIDHAMAHTLSAYYDIPHGVACAMLLPISMEFNQEVTGEKFRDIAKALGVANTESMSQEEYRLAAINAVKKLSFDVGIPTKCEKIRKEDLDNLATDALHDACYPGNPKEATHDEVKALFMKLM